MLSDGHAISAHRQYEPGCRWTRTRDLLCHVLLLSWRRRMEMSRACHAEAHRNGARRRVLCFECYRSRIDRPERV